MKMKRKGVGRREKKGGRKGRMSNLRRKTGEDG